MIRPYLGIFGDVFSAIGDVVSDAFDAITDAIGDAIITALKNFVGFLCYIVISVWCEFVSVLSKLFNVFAGVTTVEYDGDEDYLINIFFNNHAIKNIYWAMALIGMVLTILFGIISVIRVMFDSRDKSRLSLGNVLGNVFKSFIIILCMTFFITAVLNLTTVVIQRISYAFDNAYNLDQPTSVTYTEEQFAAMARIYNTIGNYSLNPSYQSRYNINSCFNEIREDMYYLQQEGLFDYPIDVTDANGESVLCWQNVLQSLANTTDLSVDLKMDVYHESVSDLLLAIMKLIETDSSFGPIRSYTYTFDAIGGENIPLDRIVFLSGTMDAARNSYYNINPGMTDAVRGPFYNGDMDIYSFSDVKEAFDYGLGGISYLTIAIVGWFVIKSLLKCIFNCIGRIFNIVGLYVVAPPFIATMPLDDGARFQQWITSFVVQCFGIFGYIIPMRLAMLFIPIILSSNLVLFAESALLNVIGKIVFICGLLTAAGEFSNIINGILANNASMASLNATRTMDAMGTKAFNPIKRIGLDPIVDAAKYPISKPLNFMQGYVNSNKSMVNYYHDYKQAENAKKQQNKGKK